MRDTHRGYPASRLPARPDERPARRRAGQAVAAGRPLACVPAAAHRCGDVVVGWTERNGALFSTGAARRIGRQLTRRAHTHLKRTRPTLKRTRRSQTYKHVARAQTHKCASLSHARLVSRSSADRPAPDSAIFYLSIYSALNDLDTCSGHARRICWWIRPILCMKCSSACGCTSARRRCEP